MDDDPARTGAPPRSEADAPDAIPFRFRACPEDFVVEELASDDEQPDPAGSHVWFTVEKRDVSTPEAARRIARALGRHPSEVQFAGRKDAVAVTRQRMSIEHVDVEVLLALDLEGIRIRDPLRCRKRLRLGQLRGNRFHLRLTGVVEDDRDRLAARLARLAEIGLPNRYGEQRFGDERGGLALGRALVSEDPLDYLEALAGRVPVRTREAARELLRRIREGTTSEKRRASELGAALDDDLRPVAMTLARRRPKDPSVLVRAVPKRSRSFHLAILQAHVFNRILEERMRRGTHATVLLGDVVLRPDGRHGVVTAERPALAGAAPTGPLWAADVLVAEGEPGRIERDALSAEGLTPDRLARPAGLSPRGARRPLVAPVGDPETGPWADGAVELAFGLPVGSYATVVLDELRGASG